MLFKANTKANIKKPSGLFITVMPGEIVDLPDKYQIHPALDIYKGTAPVKKEEPKEEKVDWKKLSKTKLDEYAETLGISLDRRKSLVDMQKQFEKLNK